MRLLSQLEKIPAPGERLLVRLALDDDVVRLEEVDGLSAATHQVVNALGRPFLTHLAEKDQIVSAEMQRAGYWELAESLLLAGMVRLGSVVLDLGANIGCHTIQLARWAGASGRVYAFEPEPANFAVLLANVLLAQAQETELAHFELQRSAVGAACGQGQLQLFADNLGLHTLLPTPGSEEKKLTVPIVTLDVLRFGDAARPPLITHRVHLIKADTQGAELDILRGGQRLIAEDRPGLCLEFEPYLTGAPRCLELLDRLESHGYRQFRLFYANDRQPERMLRHLGTYLSVKELKWITKTGALGAFATLATTPYS